MTSIEQVFSPVRPSRGCGCSGRIRAVGCAMAAEASSVPLLRRFACRVVRQWGLAEAVEEAVRLIVTELASNAVRHSGSADLVLRLAAGGGRLVLNVQDFGCWRPPAPAAAEVEEERCSGRGLDLVGAFAAHCEVTPGAAGTLVTAELLLPDPYGPRCAVCH